MIPNVDDLNISWSNLFGGNPNRFEYKHLCIIDGLTDQNQMFAKGLEILRGRNQTNAEMVSNPITGVNSPKQQIYGIPKPPLNTLIVINETGRNDLEQQIRVWYTNAVNDNINALQDGWHGTIQQLEINFGIVVECERITIQQMSIYTERTIGAGCSVTVNVRRSGDSLEIYHLQAANTDVGLQKDLRLNTGGMSFTI